MSNNQTQFKQTEVGLVPEGWDVLMVLDVADINSKSINKDYSQKEIEYLDTSSTDNGQILEWQNLSLSKAPSRAKRILTENDIIISTVRPNLKHFAILKNVKKNSIASTGYAVISATKCDPNYLFYRLTTNAITEHLSKIADTSTSTYPSIRPEVIENLKLAFPPFAEQKKIAEVLGALDDKIELNRKMNKTLESLGQVIFKRWFVDEIDENSETKKLGELLRIDRGLSYKGKYLKAFGTPMFNLGSFNIDGSLKLDSLKHYTGDYKENNTVSAGDIIVANTDMTQNRAILGSACLIPDLFGEKILFTHHVYALRVKDPIDKAFIYGVLKTRDFKDQAIGFATGTTVLSLPKESILNYEIKYPKAEKLQKFNNLFNNIVREQELLIKEINHLSQIRDSLLPRLMSGKLRANG